MLKAINKYKLEVRYLSHDMYTSELNKKFNFKCSLFSKNLNSLERR